MNADLLRYYNQELQYLRELGSEFAAAFPKVAGRLGLESFECADPYVERLLEGFSFLAARVQMKLDAECPRFTAHLAEMIYPQYLAPTPSMAVVQFEPDWSDSRLVQGSPIPRQTALHGGLSSRSTTRCVYRTGHDVKLWPLRLTSAIYSVPRPLGGMPVPRLGATPKAMLRLKFEVHGNVDACSLDLDEIPLYLRGSEGLPQRVYEQIVGHVVGACVTADDDSQLEPLRADCVSPLGFDDEHALLPLTERTLGGFRLLHEYFAFPERFLFVRIRGLREAIGRCRSSTFEVVLFLDTYVLRLEQKINASYFAMYCTPSINLFPRRTDRIKISDEQFEYQVAVDRTRPMDFEVYAVDCVRAYNVVGGEPERYQPFYRTCNPALGDLGASAYFQVRREPRVPSEREARAEWRSLYHGTEVFVALVDMDEAPFSGDLRQLGMDVLCTNRHLPLLMPTGVGKTDFLLETDAPVKSIRCVSGPTVPRSAPTDSAARWRFLNQLSLNYLPLVSEDPQRGAMALRGLLELHCAHDDGTRRVQIAGVREVSSASVTRRLPGPGPMCFGRGLQLSVTLDEENFEGADAFLLGAVLQAFFATYVTVNHSVETVVRTLKRGEIMRWPPRTGLCQIL